MNIAVFGIGFVGQVLVRELAARGHHVTAASRRDVPDLPSTVTGLTGTVQDPLFAAQATAGAQVIISALAPTATHDELARNVSVLTQLALGHRARLLVVGGSAVLPLREGEPPQFQTPGTPDWVAARARAHQQALGVLSAAPASLDWAYLVPAAQFGAHAPGVRTGSYRTSDQAQVTDAEGRSVLGVEDYAIAVADEVETPRVHQTWIAYGY